MSGAGLRNWRGEIIQPKAAAPDGEGGRAPSAGDSQRDASSSTAAAKATGRNKVVASPERKKVLRKDEFGRDVEVVVEEKETHRKTSKSERKEDRKKDRKHKHKHKHKKHEHRRDNSRERSRSQSLQGRLVGTPPPPDPFRPQLDEGRGGHLRRRREDRNRERSRSRGRSRRSRSRSHHRDRSRTRGLRSPHSSDRHRHHHRGSSGIRSRSRDRNRSRSPPSSSRLRRRRSSASVERMWTHNAFDDRSPSPPREVDPFYRPEPEAWVSRAGGVYLPRK